MTKLDSLVDNKYRGLSAAELLKAPVSALKGVSEADAALLIQALQIRTVGDLASHWSVRHAQMIAAAPTKPVILAPRDEEQASSVPPELLTQLRSAWWGLQIYANQCVRLPNTEATLSATYHTTTPGQFTWFPEVLEVYGELAESGTFFLDKVLGDVVALGGDLKTFVSDAADTADGIFPAIIDAVQNNNTQDALDLLDDRITQATNNAAKAKQIGGELADYAAQLSAASGKLSTARGHIEADEATSKNTLDTLLGGADTEGSIANLHAQLAQLNEDYHQDVVVSTTTLTYGWVVPWGLIAAVAVASVYGSRAVTALEAVHAMEQKVADAEQQAQTTWAIYTTQSLAEASVSQMTALTTLAGTQVTTVQNAWRGISTDLTNIKDDLAACVKNTSGDEQLAAKAVIKLRLTAATKAWVDLKPGVDVLMEKPYIWVAPGTQSTDDLMKAIQAA